MSGNCHFAGAAAKRQKLSDKNAERSDNCRNLRRPRPE